MKLGTEGEIDRNEQLLLWNECHGQEDCDGNHVEDHDAITESPSSQAVAKIERIEAATQIS